MALVWHPAKSKREPASIATHIKRLDPLGMSLLGPSIVCLLLALQWGGSTYAWNNARIIALFVIFGVLFLGFVAVQIWKPETATIPARIIKQRSIISTAVYILSVYSTMMLLIYYLPIWCKYSLNLISQTILTIHSPNRQTSQPRQIRRLHNPSPPQPSSLRLHIRLRDAKDRLLRALHVHLPLHASHRNRANVNIYHLHRLLTLDRLPIHLRLWPWSRNPKRFVGHPTHPAHDRHVNRFLSLAASAATWRCRVYLCWRNGAE